MITDARTLRLHDLAEDPRSVGFPPGHPPMRAFLGTPIVLRGVAYGNLYLTGSYTPSLWAAMVGRPFRALCAEGDAMPSGGRGIALRETHPPNELFAHGVGEAPIEQ